MPSSALRHAINNSLFTGSGRARARGAGRQNSAFCPLTEPASTDKPVRPQRRERRLTSRGLLRQTSADAGGWTRWCARASSGRWQKPESPSLGAPAAATLLQQRAFRGVRCRCGYKQDRVGTPKQVLSEHTGHAGEPTRRPARRPKHPRPAACREHTTATCCWWDQERSGGGSSNTGDQPGHNSHGCAFKMEGL